VKTVPLLKTLRARFLDRPLPEAVFEAAPGRLSGLRVSSRGRIDGRRFILPLGGGIVTPSFDRRNVSDPAAVQRLIEEGKKALGLGSGTVSLLIPEPCVRIFVLGAESVPAAQAEREAFFRWRVGKQMPLMPEDLRIAYDNHSGSPSGKIIVSTARDSVIREYESLFESAGLRVGTLTVPSLSLVNLLGGGLSGNGILLNIEADNLSFLAIMDSEWTLYRQKGVGQGLPAERKAEWIAKEVENTVHFLEDKERKKVERIWVRSEEWKDGAGVASRLQETLRLPAEFIEFGAPEGWSGEEKAVLAPLVGQIA
jgi:hypothetical protein